MILIGTMISSYYIVQDGGKHIISLILILFSVVGYLASLFIPKAEFSFPNEKIDYNPITSSVSFFKAVGAIPIDSKKANPKVYE